MTTTSRTNAVLTGGDPYRIVVPVAVTLVAAVVGVITGIPWVAIVVALILGRRLRMGQWALLVALAVVVTLAAVLTPALSHSY